MTRTRRVLVVGSELAAEWSELPTSSAVEVHHAAGPDAALYELAANPVDCVVVGATAAEDDPRFVDAIADRQDLSVLAVDPAEVDGADEGDATPPWVTRLAETVSDGDGASDAETVDVDGGSDAGRTSAGGGTSAAGSGPDREPVQGVDHSRDGHEGATGGPPEADGERQEGGAQGFGSEPAPVGPLTLIVADGTIVDANDQPMPPLGYDPEHLVGTQLARYVHPDDRQALSSMLSGDPNQETTVLRLEHYDGDWREVWLQRRPEPPDRWRIEVFRREIEQLPEWFPRGEDAEEMLAVIFAHIPVHLYVKDEEGRHVWVSRFHTGDTSEAIGKRDVDFDWGEFAAETYADDMQVVETGEPIMNREEYVPRQDDWNLTSKVPWFDEDGDVRGLVGVTWRITKRKQYEERLERENERLERFANVVSHDLRNPLGVAIGHLELAREERDGERLSTVAEALERMQRITSDLLTMTREGGWVSERERVSLASVARSAWDMVDTADLALEIDDDCAFEGDPDRLHHLFENLYRNVVEHGDGAVAVSVGSLEDGFYVADDGVGIPSGEEDAVFEPGGTVGEGLGLEIVRQVAEAHGWNIEAVESDAGGARFEVTGVTRLE